MKKLILLMLVPVGCLLAATAVNAGALPGTEHNAHWQIVGSDIGCVRDGLTEYGSNDDAAMTLDSPIDLSGYQGAYVFISYSQNAADSGDYTELYVNDNLVHTFADSASSTSVIVNLVEYAGGDVTPKLRWVSDASGVDEGFRFNQFEVYASAYGSGTFHEVFNWNSDSGVTYEVHDISGANEGKLACLSYLYDTNGYSYLYYWVIDNVEVEVDGKVFLDSDFEGGETWLVNQWGQPGTWEADTDHGFGSGTNWQCDSDAHPSWTFYAETLSPWFPTDATSITVSFDNYYNNYAGYDNAVFGYYTNPGTLIYDDPIDLAGWTITDDGTDVERTTWGRIKAN
jgi:hypothetical protein